jgi:deazaflavin-dependent oxidoreductase (nitroreductase family)
MVLPRWLARTNRRFTNRLLGLIPQRWSPFVILHHHGRKTGEPYTALLAAFRTEAGFLFTPTYGPDADWVRNIVAAGTCEIERRGHHHHLQSVRLIPRNEAWPNLSLPVRAAMWILGVHWFVAADVARL